jgi:DNA-binding beta-propeller fold protein YncE
LVSTTYLSGIGTGPQIAFSPSVQSTVLPLITQSNPGGIAVDGSGNFYIADYDNNEVLKESLSGGKYTESTIGGGWNSPRAIAVDGAGNVLVAESGMNRVVMETPSGGSYA